LAAAAAPAPAFAAFFFDAIALLDPLSAADTLPGSV
jgi:hypothetical protein